MRIQDHVRRTRIAFPSSWHSEAIWPDAHECAVAKLLRGRPPFKRVESALLATFGPWSPKKLRPHRGSDLVKSELLANTIPDNSAWPALQSASDSARLEQLKCVGKPEQFYKSTRISVTVPAPASNSRKGKSFTTFIRSQNTPPARHNGLGLFQVAPRDDQGNAIHRQPVDFSLTLQASQGVAIGLNLIGVELITDDNDVGSHLTTAESKFLYHLAGRSCRIAREVRKQRSSDIRIPKCASGEHASGLT
jgi:hypothetical protein